MAERDSWLSRVKRLPVYVWSYHKSLDPERAAHVGPMAEDWKSIIGLGNGATIDVIDAVGVCLKAIQELNQKVEGLEAELERARDGSGPKVS